jgi:spore coat polysaccharide biosynthesis protein SpsF
VIAAIVQARMASTRLPGKVLLDIVGSMPMLAVVLDRARRAGTVDEVIVATSDSTGDDPISDLCRRAGTRCFRGSEDDVLDRYYRAAAWAKADVIVRLTADCPLLDPAVIDLVVSSFNAGTDDYVSNTLERTYPDGLDTEVFSFGALARAWSEAGLTSEREHVTPYIWKHPDRFRIRNVASPVDLSAHRWTVDTPQDLQLVRAVYERIQRTVFGMADVVRLLETDPQIRALNAGIATNEGYERSLREDRWTPTRD